MAAAKSYARSAAIQKGMHILKYLAKQTEPASGREITEAIDIPLPTVMGYLATLCDEGMVQQVGDGYRLGMGMAIFWARCKSRLEHEREKIDRQIELLGR